MLANTPGTYAKLSKVMTGTAAECRAAWSYYLRSLAPFPRNEIVKCTRGRCDIYYWRPDGGRRINEKIGMLRWNETGTVSLYM